MTKLLEDPPAQPAQDTFRRYRFPPGGQFATLNPVLSANIATTSQLSPLYPVESPSAIPQSPDAHRDFADRNSISHRSRTNLLEQSIREEPEDDDFRFIPMPSTSRARAQSGSVYGQDRRLRRNSLFAAKDFIWDVANRDYGSFRFPAGQRPSIDLSQHWNEEKLASTNTDVVTRGTIGFILVIIGILLLLCTGIIVEITADRKIIETTRTEITSSEGPTTEMFADLRRQIIRTKHLSNVDSQERAVSDLVSRLFPPEQALRFSFVVAPGLFEDAAIDSANISSTEESVVIVGNSGVACTFALHYFLKYYCNCHVSWSARQLKLPEKFPVISEIVKKADWLHYYQNVCTSSYSYVWWNWTRWEQEIDWMALQGINFALAFNGQEEIWRRIYTDLGLTDEELADFFVGPAFLAWGRMGNIRAWAGPLPMQWMSEQVELQKHILTRMQSFGMIPILPAFNGIVPVSLLRLYPRLNLTRLSKWNNFPDALTGSYFLDPNDPLFIKLSAKFLSEAKDEFGYTSHFYNTDTFNEQRPENSSAWDADFIHRTAVATMTGMKRADLNAIWVMQAWMLHNDREFWNFPRTKALLTAVPQGHLIMLDLYAENFPVYDRTDWFFGQPFIWCMLHNFGGVLGLYGRLTSINTGPLIARNGENSTMIGVGLAPEGIEQNDIIYELMNEMSWRTDSVHLDKWVELYVNRRYGGEYVDAQRAYHVLQKTVYDCPSNWPNHGNYSFTRRPQFNLSNPIWYDPDEMLLALQLILRLKNQVEPTGLAGLAYDTVDLTRQCLQIVFHFIYEQFQRAISRRNLQDATGYGRGMQMILGDMEEILSLHEMFSIERWLIGAESWARDENQTKQFQWNALNQISLWGPQGQILDYATKQWSGIISHYYAPRWNLFTMEAVDDMEAGVPFSQSGFDIRVFHNVEEAFTHSTLTSFQSKAKLFQANEAFLSRAERILMKAEELHEKYHKYRSEGFLKSLLSGKAVACKQCETISNLTQKMPKEKGGIEKKPVKLEIDPSEKEIYDYPPRFLQSSTVPHAQIGQYIHRTMPNA